MGQHQREKNVWIQRIDPLAIFLPVILLGIIGMISSIGTTALVFFNISRIGSSTLGLDPLVMGVFPMSEQLFVVIFLAIGLAVGYAISRRLESITESFLENGNVQFRINGMRYAIIIMLVCVVIGGGMDILYDAAIVALGHVLTYSTYVLAFAITGPIGVKYGLDYYEINGYCYERNSRLEAYLCGSEPSPELVEYISSAVGGSSLQMFDSRVKSILLSVGT